MIADPFRMIADPFRMKADPFRMIADPFRMIADPFRMIADPDSQHWLTPLIVVFLVIKSLTISIGIHCQILKIL